ncbi:hypothetical protein EYF80_019146 [Liparis tanakae]|uniref:Uncharacterized protein n=1 Tax=Liparis tanakae TaxID=230148 RepID=A0A4Z2I008_9TELE|nr:hypothetical protein EYF80_019146 [Liparis tanakae]
MKSIKKYGIKKTPKKDTSCPFGLTEAGCSSAEPHLTLEATPEDGGCSRHWLAALHDGLFKGFGKTIPLKIIKEHDYRLVFFWSLDLGVQTPEDGRTGGREDGRTVFLRWDQQLT